MILASLAAWALLAPVQNRIVELSRGAIVSTPGGPVTYLDATDTTLDQTAPESGFGGQGILYGGPKRTILLRFGDLNRVVGPGWKVADATLTLTVNGGRSTSLTGISRVKTAWSEGPLNTLARVLAAHGAPLPASRGEACWKFARFGDAATAWKGATDGTAVTFDASKTKAEALVVDQLGPAVEYFVEHPVENHGWALLFSDNVEFLSAQSNELRPKLTLNLMPAPPVKGPDLSVISIASKGVGLVATVKNVGDAPAPAFKAAWIRDGVAGEPQSGVALGPGDVTTFTLGAPPFAERTDHRWRIVDFRIEPGADGNPINDGLRYYVGGREIPVTVGDHRVSTHLRGSASIEDWVQSQATIFNEVYLALSRYSFAPDGAKERVNLIPTAIEGGIALPATPNPLGADAAFLKSIGLACGLRDLKIDAPNHPGDDPFAGVMGGGDTRNETVLSARLPLPNVPRTPADEFTGLLAMTDVWTLNRAIDGTGEPKRPPVAIAFVKDLNGEVLTNLTLDFFAPTDLEKPIATVKVDRTGSFIIPAAIEKVDAIVRGRSFNSEAWAWLKSWQISDAVARGGGAAVVVEMRLNLSTAPLDNTEDLAKDRPVTASSTEVGDLLKLTSGDGKTPIKLGENDKDWIEIDLRKDRTLGEIILGGAGPNFWKRFDIRVYGTGDKVDESLVWTSVSDGAWLARTQGDGEKVAIRGPIVRVRFIRIINRGGGPGALNFIRVTPVKAAGANP